MRCRRDAFAAALFAASIVLAVLGLAFVLAAAARRADVPAEAELLFEAMRVGRGRALYVDPAVGAWDDGGPPSRFYVLYTPTWPWLLGHLAGGRIASIRAVGRALAAGAWLTALAVPVVGSSPARRRSTATAALLAMGTYLLARHGASATPDTLAVALEAIALVRTARRDRVDAVSAALFVIAPLVKPSCIGVCAGAAIACALRGRVVRPGAVASAATAAVLAAVACHAVSDGAWMTHIVRSTAQPLTVRRWVQEMGDRALLLGVPHLTVAALALRRKAPILVSAPLVASIAWSSFAMAKHGSGTQYWLEPTMVAITAIAFMPAARPARTTALVARIAAASLASLVAATSFVGYAREIAQWRADAARMDALGRHCGLQPGDVVASSDAAVELALDGRLLVPVWQTSFLARRGLFPAEAWAGDLRDPHVRWLVLTFDPAQPAADTNDARIEVSAFRDILRPTVDETFVRDATVGGFVVYRKTEREFTGRTEGRKVGFPSDLPPFL
jgi:hypothetical protein